MSFPREKVFKHGMLLLLGSLLSTGKRTVCKVLRTLGLSSEMNWHKYHRFLSRSNWNILGCSRILLMMLLEHFPSNDPLVIGIDETLERRWGKKIKARGMYHDSCRSSKSRNITSSGLRWLGVMLLTKVGWSERVWALPFLTVLSPSEKYHQEEGKKHKTVTDWARQIANLLHHWLPNKEKIIVADNSYARMELFESTRDKVKWIVRSRFDIHLCNPAPARKKGEQGPPRKKGKKQPNLSERMEREDTNWVTTQRSNNGIWN